MSSQPSPVPSTSSSTSSSNSAPGPSTSTQSTLPQQNQKRKRVRTGCITCRVRRVKCDEARPHCIKCTSTGRKCDGYDAPSISRNELARAIKRGEPLTSLQYGSNSFSSSEERQAFEFFRRNTAVAGEANILDWGFWDHIILQFVHTDSAIKHGVLALSALHRNFARGHEDYAPTSKLYYQDPKTIQWYSKALIDMNTLFESIDTDPSAVQKVIAASIIFICIENLLIDPKAARTHLEMALRIAKEDQVKRARRGRLNSTESVVTQALNRLDFGAMTLSSSEVPYPWKLGAEQTTHTVRVPTTFTSLHQGEMWLFTLLKDMFTFGRSLLSIESAFEILGKTTRAATWYIQQMTNWKLAFEPLAAHLERLDETTKNRCLLLRVYHRLGFMLGSAGFMPTEMGWDSCDEQFTEMLDWVDALPTMALDKTVFSLEPGVLVPLFLCSSRCRNPQIRRRAIALMLKQRRKEMVWESHGAAQVAQWLMDLEERGKHPKTADGRPHEMDRFRVVDVDIDLRNATVHTKAFFASETSPSKLRTVKESLKVCMGTGRKEECACWQRFQGSEETLDSSRAEWEFDRELFDSERIGNARGWVPLGRIPRTSDKAPEELDVLDSAAAMGLFDANDLIQEEGTLEHVNELNVSSQPAGATAYQEDFYPAQDEITWLLTRTRFAQEAIGERHIAMMKWTAEKYEYEKSKLKVPLPTKSRSDTPDS